MQGTLPFMAIQILQAGAKTPHRSTHDLESIFYVLVWICTMYTGPWDQERVFRRLEHTPLLSWCQHSTGGLSEIGDVKLGHCSTQEPFIDRILNNFTPYFDDLKPCCLQLRELFFASPRADVKHDEMRDILQKALNELNPELLPKNPVTISSAFADAAYRSGHQLEVQEEADEEVEEEADEEVEEEADEEVEEEADEEVEEEMDEETEEEVEKEPIGSDDDMEVEVGSDRDTEGEDEEEKMTVTLLYKPDVRGHAFQRRVRSASPVVRSSSPLARPTQRRYRKQ